MSQVTESASVTKLGLEDSLSVLDSECGVDMGPLTLRALKCGPDLTVIGILRTIRVVT